VIVVSVGCWCHRTPGRTGMGETGRWSTFSLALCIGYAVLPLPLLDVVLKLRARTDRQPPILIDEVVTQLLDQGHFAAHLRRARRSVLKARGVLEQRFHLVAWLPSGVSDEPVAAAAGEKGISVRPLSPLFISAPSQHGLILGFAEFSEDQVSTSARRLAQIINAACC
jgi:GntR family transcriptional regulator / MocR family aminotransferase